MSTLELFFKLHTPFVYFRQVVLYSARFSAWNLWSSLQHARREAHAKRLGRRSSSLRRVEAPSSLLPSFASPPMSPESIQPPLSASHGSSSNNYGDGRNRNDRLRHERLSSTHSSISGRSSSSSNMLGNAAMAQVEAALLGRGSHDNNDEDGTPFHGDSVSSNNEKNSKHNGSKMNISKNYNGSNSNGTGYSSDNNDGNGNNSEVLGEGIVHNPLFQSTASTAAANADDSEGPNHDTDNSADSFTEVALHDEANYIDDDDNNAMNDDMSSSPPEEAMPFEVRIPIVLTCVTCTMVVALW